MAFNALIMTLKSLLPVWCRENMPSPFRRACDSCVKAKRKCDLAAPICYRCRVRNLKCCYVNERATEPQSLPTTLAQSHDQTQEDSALQAARRAHKLYGSLVPVMPNLQFVDFSEIENGPSSSTNDNLPRDFPDFNLDWPDIMQNIEQYQVADNLSGIPSDVVVSGEIYQSRVVYAVKCFSAWPTLFVETGRAPFINSSAGRMADCLQEALAICALYGARNGRNRDLVIQILTERANSCVENVWTASPSQQLAALQALILYQIMRLFDGDIRLRADAERAESILKAWTRQVQSYLVPAGLVQTVWEQWLFEESIRRTIIVSYNLQGLYSFMRNGWDISHHEFRLLSFTAQQALWNATNEHIWNEAVQHQQAIAIHFETFSLDLASAQASDLEHLGVVVLALSQGVDRCVEFLGRDAAQSFDLISSCQPDRLNSLMQGYITVCNFRKSDTLCWDIDTTFFVMDSESGNMSYMVNSCAVRFSRHELMACVDGERKLGTPFSDCRYKFIAR